MTGADLKAKALLGYGFSVGPQSAVCDRILGQLVAGRPSLVAHGNVHCLHTADREADLAAILRQPETLLLFEGIGLKLVAALRQREWWDDVNGTDLVPAVLQAAPEGTRVALIGGPPGRAARAADRWQRAYPHLRFPLVLDGYGDISDKARVARAVRTAKSELVLLGLGSPLQERFGAALRAQGTPSVIWCVGGLFEFVAGSVPRAPAVVRWFRLEWLWRIAQEPSRLGPRFAKEAPWIGRQLMRAPPGSLR